MYFFAIRTHSSTLKSKYKKSVNILPSYHKVCNIRTKKDVTNTGNGERGTGNREQESGN